MNLTSKRMLQIIAGCAGAFALSATAQSPWVSDNFEYVGVDYGTTNGVVDMPIAAYKCQPYGTANEFTNYQWFVESTDDLSKLVSVPQNYSGGKRPIPGSDTNLVLNLETNGKTLVRTNNASLDFSSSPVYVDTLIKFTPSEDNPTISDPSVKAAVFLDANLHLWIYHGVDSAGGSPTSSDTGLVVSTNEWHRLTIMLSTMPGYSDLVFKVYVDSQEVSCSAGMDGDYNPGGPWYYSASIEGSFAAVAFQGTGLVDELVVADTCDLTTDTGTWLTLVFDPAQVIVSTSGVAVANNDEVVSGTQVAVTAKPWFQITSGGALMANATSNLFDTTTFVTGIVGTVVGSDGETNTVTAEAFSSTSGLPTGFGSASIGDIITWANANGVNPEGLTDAMLDDYLLNVAPATDAELTITKITYGASEVTVEIEATSASVDFTAINGVLNIWTTDDLVSTAFTPIGTFAVTATVAEKITVTVPVGDGKFIKATVDTTDLVE